MNQKHVAVYTSLSRLSIPSGVPRHVVEVVGGLLEDPSLQISFFVNSSEADQYLSRYAPRWAESRQITFSKPVATMARRWGLLNRPSFESMRGQADWLYLPADGYVPVERTKMAVTIHDVYKLEAPAPGENRLRHYYARARHWVIYKRVADHAQQILTVSRFSADRIMHHLGVPACRVQVVYNGVSSAFYNPDLSAWTLFRDALGLAEGERFYVYMGGLKAKKNGAGIIAAWQLFEEARSDVSLVVLGHHDPAMLEKARRQLRRAIFPPRLNDIQLAALLRHCVALFFPSFYEGFGIPVVEAMAAGTLTVLSDIPPLREIAGDLPYYVDPSNPKSMAEGLRECLACNAVERNDRVTVAKQIAERYTWSQVVRRVREIFE